MGDSSAPIISIIARVVVAPLPSASTRERAMTRARTVARTSSSSSSSSASSSSSSSEDDEDEDVRSRHTGGGALFDDDSDSDERDDGDETKSDDDDDGLTINRAFAKRFEHNERRKEMHRLRSNVATPRSRLGDGTSVGGGVGERFERDGER